MHAAHPAPRAAHTARPAAVAAAYGVLLWAIATALIAAAGEIVLAPIDTLQGVVVVVVATAGTAVLAVALTRDFLRRTGRADQEAALTFGVVAGGIGLALDALLLLVTGFDYPGVGAAETPTLVVALMAAYAAVVMVPGLAVRRS